MQWKSPEIRANELEKTEFIRLRGTYVPDSVAVAADLELFGKMRSPLAKEAYYSLGVRYHLPTTFHGCCFLQEM